MDENPITGEPGAFHLSTTGRKEKDKLAVPKGLAVGKVAPPPLKTIGIEEAPKKSKGEKTPTKSPGVKGPKRRKSKAVNATGGMSPT